MGNQRKASRAEEVRSRIKELVQQTLQANSEVVFEKKIPGIKNVLKNGSHYRSTSINETTRCAAGCCYYCETVKI
ncbi:MAG TPA: hypothetical protein ENJ04_05795 [Nitrospirae bacterium]|nr:hypothetical protein [Nitrospirota bacterium]